MLFQDIFLGSSISLRDRRLGYADPSLKAIYESDGYIDQSFLRTDLLKSSSRNFSTQLRHWLQYAPLKKQGSDHLERLLGFWSLVYSWSVYVLLRRLNLGR